MTEKLFYEDSHMITFSAVVKTCEQVGEYYEAVLDRTAFFPEGGGQLADPGLIDGIRVLDVQEREGVIYHTVEKPLTPGCQVEGQLDWEERFSRMQQHSGEHIVSGIVHQKYGYDNVGFHMGTDAITIDFNGVLTKSQLQEIEELANRVVTENVEFQVLYPKREELESIYYRSKIEIEGQVRLVIVPGYDACACCAPHVKKSGEIGIIKFVGLQNYKGGVRVSLLCGFRALHDYELKCERMKELSVMLSAPEHEIVDEVSRLKEELSAQKEKIYELQMQLLQSKVHQIEDNTTSVVLFEEGLEGNGPRELVNLILEKNVGVGAVFAATENEDYRYVIGSRCVDVRELSKELNNTFNGRGGGKPEMVQGSLAGAEATIRKEIEALIQKLDVTKMLKKCCNEDSHHI